MATRTSLALADPIQDLHLLIKARRPRLPLTLAQILADVKARRRLTSADFAGHELVTHCVHPRNGRTALDAHVAVLEMSFAHHELEAKARCFQTVAMRTRRKDGLVFGANLNVAYK